MIRTIADQYLAQNAGRRYPFRDDTPDSDVPPDAAILDFRCTLRGVPAGTVPEARLTHVEATGTGKRLTVSAGAFGTLAFTVTADIASSAPYTAYASDPATGATGALTVSEAALSLPDRAMDAPFAATTVVCDSLKVMSLQSAHDAADARDESDPTDRDPVARLTGEIVLAEGRNAEPYLDGHHLRLDIRKGAGLGENCQSVSSSQTCDNVLFTINGERPGSNGDIRIAGEGGISVTARPEEHAITIKLDDVARDRLAKECASTCNGD